MVYEVLNGNPSLKDKFLGALLGGALGEAMGIPVDGLSHQNIRTYYKGVKTLLSDERRRGTVAGAWGKSTEDMFAVGRLIAELGQEQKTLEGLAARMQAYWYTHDMPSVDVERTGDAAVWGIPIGLWWAYTSYPPQAIMPVVSSCLYPWRAYPEALIAGYGQAFITQWLYRRSTLNERLIDAFWDALQEVVYEAENAWEEHTHSFSMRLEHLRAMKVAYPLDLGDACGGVRRKAIDSWPFAVAMFARAPHLLEATLLSAINVGGSTALVGTLVGALLGEIHGWEAFPSHWRQMLQEAHTLEQKVDAFMDALRQNSPTNPISGSSQ